MPTLLIVGDQICFVLVVVVVVVFFKCLVHLSVQVVTKCNGTDS